jgi:hypothetical protein
VKLCATEWRRRTRRSRGFPDLSAFTITGHSVSPSLPDDRQSPRIIREVRQRRAAASARFYWEPLRKTGFTIVSILAAISSAGMRLGV